MLCCPPPTAHCPLIFDPGSFPGLEFDDLVSSESINDDEEEFLQ